MQQLTFHLCGTTAVVTGGCHNHLTCRYSFMYTFGWHGGAHTILPLCVLWWPQQRLPQLLSVAQLHCVAQAGVFLFFFWLQLIFTWLSLASSHHFHLYRRRWHLCRCTLRFATAFNRTFCCPSSALVWHVAATHPSSRCRTQTHTYTGKNVYIVCVYICMYLDNYTSLAPLYACLQQPCWHSL